MWQYLILLLIALPLLLVIVARHMAFKKRREQPPPFLKIANVNAQEYLSIITVKLKYNKYQIKNNLIYDTQLFELVAKRTRFEFVAFITSFFLISRFTMPEIHTLKEFSSRAFNYSKKASGIHPPRGLLYALRCIPVAIVDSISKETIEYVRFSDPPKHWAAPVKLVVFSLEEQKLYFWERSFTEDYLDADLDRKIIKEMLSPSKISNDI